ncbi:unnamed protein product, partial [Ectocarpus sp. 13 AM-2016]
EWKKEEERLVKELSAGAQGEEGTRLVSAFVSCILFDCMFRPQTVQTGNECRWFECLVVLNRFFLNLGDGQDHDQFSSVGVPLGLSPYRWFSCRGMRDPLLSFSWPDQLRAPHVRPQISVNKTP